MFLVKCCLRGSCAPPVLQQTPQILLLPYVMQYAVLVVEAALHGQVSMARPNLAVPESPLVDFPVFWTRLGPAMLGWAEATVAWEEWQPQPMVLVTVMQTAVPSHHLHQIVPLHHQLAGHCSGVWWAGEPGQKTSPLEWAS